MQKAIPVELLMLLPKRNMPVTCFIKQKLPVHSMGFNTYAAATWFNSDEPQIQNQDKVFDFPWKKRKIPPMDALLKLENEYGQQWLDGKRSIVDPRYNKGSERLPLFVLTLWKEGSTIVQKWKDWADAYGCVEQEIQKGPRGIIAEAYQNVDSFLGLIGWDSDVNHGGFIFTFRNSFVNKVYAVMSPKAWFTYCSNVYQLQNLINRIT